MTITFVKNSNQDNSNGLSENVINSIISSVRNSSGFQYFSKVYIKSNTDLEVNIYNQDFANNEHVETEFVLTDQSLIDTVIQFYNL